MTRQWKSALAHVDKPSASAESIHQAALAFALPANIDKLMRYQQFLNRELYRAHQILRQRQRDRLESIAGEIVEEQ